MFMNVRKDIEMYLDQYRHINPVKRIIYLIFTQELHAVLIYRFGRWAKYECNIPIIREISKLLYFFLRKLSEMFFGIGIWPECDIGPGLKIEHWGSVIVVAKKIGKNCRISQQVTIGYIGGFKGGDRPIIGDNVYIGAGAKVLGDIKIGNNVKIGANAVVIKDVPDNAIAVGVPATIKFTKNKPMGKTG
jgi:serine O-acetyltransferase